MAPSTLYEWDGKLLKLGDPELAPRFHDDDDDDDADYYYDDDDDDDGDGLVQPSIHVHTRNHHYRRSNVIISSRLLAINTRSLDSRGMWLRVPRTAGVLMFYRLS